MMQPLSEQQKKLLARLRDLRLAAGETCQACLLHIEQGTAEIMEQVSGGDGNGKKKRKTLNSAVVKNCIEILDKFPIIKTKKGWHKDLSRIEDVVGKLARIISKSEKVRQVKRGKNKGKA